jgi:hypothetical protein
MLIRCQETKNRYSRRCEARRLQETVTQNAGFSRMVLPGTSFMTWKTGKGPSDGSVFKSLLVWKGRPVSATITLLDLAGDVGLLLWGTHMVTTGVLRGYGTDFRRRLGSSLSRRMNAFLAGLVVTAILQSSTATALMATSFAASGILELVPGLAVMLGANVGTTSRPTPICRCRSAALS